MAPILTQFDQTLIGLGIYIPSSPSSSGTSSDHPSSSTFDAYSESAAPSSSSTGLLSPPTAFRTPQSQTRRSRVHVGNAPVTLGTRGGFKPYTGEELPKSIYLGEENPFLPLPTADEEISSPEEETSEELRLPGEAKKGLRRRSKEYDDLILPSDLDLDSLPESTFSQPQLLSPAFVARSSRYIPRARRNLGTGADPSLAGYSAPGPNPSFPSSEVPIPPQTPRPAPDDTYTPSTPIPDYSSASPHPTPIAPTPTPGGGGGRSMGLVASALAEDIAPVTNPLFVASIALSVVLGVLIVGIVSCSVAYCRRGKGRRGDTEKGDGSGEVPGSPKRASLAGVYRTPGEKGLRSSDTLTSFSTRNSTVVAGGSEVGSRPPSILKQAEDTAASPSAGAGAVEDGSGGRVSFAEMLGGDSAEGRQLYSAPKWQDGLAQAAPISTPTTVSSESSPSTPSQPTASSSRLSICAVPSLSSVQEEPSPSSPSTPSRPSSVDAYVPSYPHSDSMARIDDDGAASTSYHSCSDNSSMTTHASDDAFGYTSRPTSVADSLFASQAGSRPTSLASSHMPTSLRDRTSVASSTTSFTPLDYPLYLIDRLTEDGDDTGDMSFDTLSSLSLATPRASPSPPPSLDSPLPLQSVLAGKGKKDRRKTIDGWMSPSPVVRLRTRFAVDDDEEEDEEDGEADEADGEEGDGQGVVLPGEGLSSYALFTEAFGSSGDIKRSLSLPSKPVPASASKSVLKRALSALRTASPAPPLPGPVSALQYGPPTPPRPSRSRSLPRPSGASGAVTIIHQSDLERSSLPSPPTAETPDGEDGIARFSTASWDQLRPADAGGFDAYYLGYDGAIRPHRDGDEDDDSADGDDGQEGEEGEGDEDIMAEINQARISFFLSSEMGHSEGCTGVGMETLRAFPEPASHLPYIRVTSH